MANWKSYVDNIIRWLGVNMNIPTLWTQDSKEDNWDVSTPTWLTNSNIPLTTQEKKKEALLKSNSESPLDAFTRWFKRWVNKRWDILKSWYDEAVEIATNPDEAKKVNDLWIAALDTAWDWFTDGVLDTLSLGFRPLFRAVDKREDYAYERRKAAWWYWTWNDTPLNETPIIADYTPTEEQIASAKANEEMSTKDYTNKLWNEWLYMWQWLITQYSKAKQFLSDDVDEESYDKDIQILANIKQLVNDWQITQESYDDIVEQYSNMLYKKYWKTTTYSAFSDTKWMNNDWFADAIKNDVNNIFSLLDIDEKIKELDPNWKADEESSTKISNDTITYLMESVNDALKYNTSSNKQEVIDWAYTSVSDWVSNAVNVSAPARRVIKDLSNKYWWADPSTYLEWDKAAYDYAMKVQDLFNRVVFNKWEYYKDLISTEYVDWILTVPERVKWRTVQQYEFDWMDNFINDDDYEWLWLFDKNSYSAIDLLWAMSAKAVNMYVDAGNASLWGYIWEGLQYNLRPIWPLVQEVWQQTVWQFIGLYNLSSKHTWRIDFSLLDSDNALLSVMSTNQSTFWRLTQRYTAWIMSYAPELLSEIVATYIPLSRPGRIRNISSLRLLLNNNTWKVLRLIKSASKAKWISLIKWIQEASQTGRIIHNWEVIFDVEKQLWNGSKRARTLNWLATNALVDVWMDQLIDASLSSADTDFGSDVSMIFSLWGTFLWNVLPKLWEAWLFRMWRNVLENIATWNIKNLKSYGAWKRWTVRDFIEMIDPDNINRILKQQFWASRSLANTNLWDLIDLTESFRDISKLTKKALSTLTNEEARRVTQAIKNWVYEEIKPYINQVYWQQSEFARKVAKLAADERTNIADLTKYLLWVDTRLNVLWWQSIISLSDGSRRFWWNYKEALDTVFKQWNFRKKMQEWFTLADLEELQKNWYSWANVNKWYMRKVWDDKYYFTKEWLDAAKNDIRTSSMNIVQLSKASKSAEEFDSLMRNSGLKNISDETLDDIKDSWAYDLLADTLAEIEQLCWLWF